MAKRSGLYPSGAGAYSGGVGTATQAQGNVLLPPGMLGNRFGIDFSAAHTWVWIFYVAAWAYVLFIYQAHGGRRGGIL